MSNRTGKWALSAAVTFCIVSVLAFVQVAVATVRLPREDNRLFAAVKTALGGDIRLHYRHSVEKTAVEGRFVVGTGPVLQAVETRMTSVGTGLPNTDPNRTRREGKWIVVNEGLQEIQGFDFIISPINSPRLVIGGIGAPIGNLASGSVIRIDVEKICIARWLLWQYFKIEWKRDQQ